MTDPILIIQTAFAGDLVLTTPLIEETAERHPSSPIDVLCIPSTAPLLAGHPSIRRCIVYDKHRRSPSLLSLMRSLARECYGLCLCPHRSLRSALLARATRAARRITFDRSAAPWLFTATVAYQDAWHEVDRNRSLLWDGQRPRPEQRRPRLYPSENDRSAAATVAGRGFCDGSHPGDAGMRPYVCIAPGSVWATKRWTEEGFADVLRHFRRAYRVILTGGTEDRSLCDRIIGLAGGEEAEGSACAVNAAGELGFLASAALIGGAELLISNDSAPVHLASAMGTPVVEIYGATVPAFGFSAYGVPHRFVQREDLACRPCAIHGGDRCPIRTFECMRGLEAGRVVGAGEELLAKRST